MIDRVLPLLAWSLFGLSLLLVAVSFPLLLLNIPRTGFSFVPFFLQISLTLVYSALGALIALRQPHNAVGWILVAIGLSAACSDFSVEYALYGFVTAPGSLPIAGLLAWLGPWVFQSAALLVALFLLLFPDGHPPSPRWRPLVWIVVTALCGSSLGQLLTPGEITAGNQGVYHEFTLMPNPTAVPALAGLLTATKSMFGPIVLVAIIGVVASLIWRLRRGRIEERQQVKWLAYAAGLFFAIVVVEIAVSRFGPPRVVGDIGWAVGALTVVYAFPAAATVAILKYRLYDIDLVINRSLVFGALALFISAVYVLIVAGLGSIIGSGAQPNVALSVLATAVVAVAFQPVREQVERLANRLVYGKRATPYEVLAQFTDRVGGAYGSEDILPRMAQVLAEGTGAARADVWLRVSDHIAPTASWPAGDGATMTSVGLTGDRLPAVAGVTRVAPVRHQGELLGALSINKRPAETLMPVEERLLNDLASQAGLVLRNVRLTADLRARLKEISQQALELRLSRQRIVAAQDEERRRLERNIHDGAQQHLVALTVKLRLAASQARRNPEQARATVRALDAETDDALNTLRDLARGIYPPILREQGLIAALEASVARMDLSVEITGTAVGRYSSETEAAVYFTCLEALQNAAKHAEATSVRLTLEPRDGSLSFSVTDDGKGFDPAAAKNGSGLQNMIDRIEAVGGKLSVAASAGRGTTVNGWVPVASLEPVS